MGAWERARLLQRKLRTVPSGLARCSAAANDPIVTRLHPAAPAPFRRAVDWFIQRSDPTSGLAPGRGAI